MKAFFSIVFLIGLLFVFQPAARDLQGRTAGAVTKQNQSQDQTEKKKEEEKKKEKKKETEKKETKKKETKKKKVFTDKDLKNITGVNVTYIEPDPKTKSQTQKSQTKKTQTQKTSAQKKQKVDPKKTEEYWRGRWSKIQANIKNSEKKIKEMKEKLLRLQLEHPRIDLMNERKQREDEMARLAQDIVNYEKGLETLKNKLADLEDEARKEGVPPGWLR
jgi:hypothetical protein